IFVLFFLNYTATTTIYTLSLHDALPILAYKTIKEALMNKMDFFPSPKMLSRDIQEGDFLKPIKVKKIHKKDSVFEYELVGGRIRSEEHTSELQSQSNLVCRLLLEKKKIT